MSKASLWQRVRSSLQASAGEVVFGMEDGTVSIFGLVFGVAATTTDQKAVLIAGASGAVAAAVSMMAGTYLDAETGQDQVRVMARRIDAEMQKDKAEVLDGVTQRLQAAGLPPDQAATVGGFLCAQPSVLRSVAMALAEPRRGFAARPAGALAVDADRRFPRCRHSDPAVRLSRRAAGPRGVGHGHDAAVGRAGRRAAKIGGRPMVRTVIETVSIGVAAAAAGVGIGVWISQIFT